jgi:hypothetical protein
MKTSLVTLWLVLTFSAVQVYGQTSTILNSEKKNMNEDTLTWKATVVKVPFINKRGKEVEGMSDLYLQKDGKKYFIKFMGGKVLRKDVENYLEKEITVELSLQKGNLDTNDGNNYQQSRVGEYVLLYKIVE